MKDMTFTTAKGVPMRVVYLAPGEAAAFPAATDPHKSLVEFYDTRYDFTPFGQFTGGRYFAEHFGDRPSDAGLMLDGGVPEWDVDPENTALVRAFIREQEAVDA